MRPLPPGWDTPCYPHAPEMSLEEVAREMGMSKQQVKNIERRALAKIRAWLGVPDPNPPRFTL